MLCYQIARVVLLACYFKYGDAVPTFTAPTNGDGSVNLDENVPVGHSVFTVTADPTTDKNLGEFTLVTQNTPFTLAVGGELTVATATIDYESKQSYVLLIQVVDDEPSTATATLTINVQNAEDPPSFESDSYSVCVKDSSIVGTTVTTFAATDQDTDDASLTYSITSGNTNSDFAVETKYLKVAKVLDSETTASYTLVVQVSDGTSTDTANFVVTVSTTCESAATALVASLAALLIGLVCAIN